MEMNALIFFWSAFLQILSDDAETRGSVGVTWLTNSYVVTWSRGFSSEVTPFNWSRTFSLAVLKPRHLLLGS